MSFASLLETTLLGVQTGMTLILIASGLTLVFGLMDVANLAHGSFVMLGAYFGFAIVTSGLGNFWLALVAVPIALGAIAFGVERLTIRPLYEEDPLNTLLVTLGLAIIVQEAVSLVWGSHPKSIDVPAVISGSTDLGLFTYPTFRLFLLVCSLLIVLGIWYVLSRSDFGIIMRASEHDPEMVEALGRDVWAIYTVVFVVGAMLAGFGGVLLGGARAIDPGMGLAIIIQAFAIIVIGGLGSFRGAVIGSLVIGLLTVFGALYFPAFAEMMTFVLMGIVLIVKPSGLFGGTAA